MRFEHTEDEKKLASAMQVGFDAIQNQELVAGCELWAQAWEVIKQLTTPEMRSTSEFDEAHPRLPGPIHDYCQDYEMELGNAARDERRFHDVRLRFVTEFLERFPGESAITTLNMMRAKGEALWELGQQADAEATFAAIIERFPDDAWGYIGWADQFWLSGPVGFPKDHERAEALLQRALARPALEHRDDVLERMEGLYEDWGKPDRRAAIAAERAALRGGPGRGSSGRLAGSPPVAPSAPVVTSKVGRNDPCPCGSGKKFKKCCLAKGSA